MGGGGRLGQQEVVSSQILMQNLEALNIKTEGIEAQEAFTFCHYAVLLLVNSLEMLSPWSWLKQRFCGLSDTTFLFSPQEAFSDLALFFYDKHGGEVIAVLWKPLSFQPQPFKVSF